MKHTTFHTIRSKTPYKNSDFRVKLRNDKTALEHV
jgi:hypothetical protein